jgi:hypothetical protein
MNDNFNTAQNYDPTPQGDDRVANEGECVKGLTLRVTRLVFGSPRKKVMHGLYLVNNGAGKQIYLMSESFTAIGKRVASNEQRLRDMAEMLSNLSLAVFKTYFRWASSNRPHDVSDSRTVLGEVVVEM